MPANAVRCRLRPLTEHPATTAAGQDPARANPEHSTTAALLKEGER